MNKKRNKIIRIGAIAVFVVMFVVLMAVMSIRDESLSAQFTQGEDTDIMNFNPFIENEKRLDNSLLEYGKVLNKYAQDDIPDYKGDPIVMKGNSGKVKDGTVLPTFNEDYVHEESGCVVKANPEAVVIEDKVTLIYEFKVSETALYNLNLEYFMPEDKSNNVLVSFTINGKRPFFNASNVQLTRLYEHYNVGNLDDMGNEIKAKQRETFAWQSYTFGSTEGFYKDPYKILLQGSDKVQTLEITFSMQDVVVGDLSFVAPVETPTYEDYRKGEHANEPKYTGESLGRIEIEEAITVKNSVKLVMSWDENYCSSPASFKEINYNIFGGEGWSEGDQSLTFTTCEVKKAGWYQIAFRYKSPISDIVAHREIRIDGEIPFEEMKEYCFPASDSWICEPLKNDKQQPYLFYLTEGTHEITMTAKLGPARHEIQALEDATDYINDLVKKVVQVTGSSRNEDGTYNVDTNRDWDLQVYIPTIKEDVETCHKVLLNAYEDISKLNGDKIPYYLPIIKVTADLFGKLAEDTEAVPASINDIVTNVASITDNIVNIKKQGLTLDYMVIDQTGKEYDDVAISNFWQNMYVAGIRFARSFTTDYASIGVVAVDGQEDYPEIQVYVSTGREQYEWIRSLVTENFTANQQIKVDLTMVAGTEGLIMLRYVAGTAPDASITFGGGSVVEYAMRGALYPLDTIEGFSDYLNVETSNFTPNCFVPGLYKGHYYGIPETMSWNAMFYRTDIMEELGIDVKAIQTWDDVYDILPILQENEMEFASNYSVGGYWPFMYQHGAEMYDPNGKVSALNSQAAYDAYVEYANLYIKYKMPMNVNFYQRFRNGDVPIGVANAGLYSQLKVAAPEIIGKWDFVPIPGHINEDGEVDRSSGAQGAMCIIVDNYKGEDKKNEERFKNPNEKIKNSFKFLQWWTGTEAQAAYAQETEVAYGVASRYCSSNKSVLETQPYTDEEVANILEQWRWVRESPNVPGGYYTERWLVTALNKTVLQGENPRANLEDAIKEINKELKRKQEEFGIGEKDSVVGSEWLEDYPPILKNKSS